MRHAHQVDETRNGIENLHKNGCSKVVYTRKDENGCNMFDAAANHGNGVLKLIQKHFPLMQTNRSCTMNAGIQKIIHELISGQKGIFTLRLVDLKTTVNRQDKSI